MSFGVYLVGTFETRLGIFSQFQIVNPTAEQIELLAVFLNPGGTVLACRKAELNPNALWEIDSIQLGKALKSETFGVAKFFSRRDEKLYPGIVGFQRLVAAGPGSKVDYAALGESNLAAVPKEIAEKDLVRVEPMCP